MKYINNKVKNLEMHDEGEYIYFTYDDNKTSETIKVSPIIEELSVKYGKKKKYLNFFLENEDKHYGTVEEIVFEDKKNITYKKKDHKKVVHIYRPYGFDKNKEYGVIYMFDSDNLFDLNKVGKYTSFMDDYGGWQIESSLNSLKSKYGFDFIVVGISSSDGYRDTELTPYFPYQELRKEVDEIDKSSFKNGKLDNLGDFIKETLFKYVEEHFKINKKYIGIGGASSGGVAAHYLALRDLGSYTFALAFSPASGIFTDETWIKFYEEINLKDNIDKVPYIFFYQGANEGVEILLYLGNLEFVNMLEKFNYPMDKIESYINKNWRHNEIAWRLAFNYAIDKCYLSLSKK